MKTCRSSATTRWVYDSAHRVDVGRNGVVLFCAISGFVIPFSVRRDAPAPVRDFLLRRFFRIVPLYWLSIPIGALTCHLIWGRPFPLRWIGINAALLQDVVHVPPAIGLYWTLVVEVLFYLMCAALLFARSLFDYRRVAALVVVLVGLHLAAVVLLHFDNTTANVFLTSFWFLHFGIMFWGSLYRAWQQRVLDDRFARVVLWALPLTWATIYPLYCSRVLAFPLSYYLPYVLAFATFIAGTTVLRVTWRLTAWLGEISYSIYLWHPVVFNVLLWLLLRTDEASWWRTRHLGVYVAGVAVVTVFFSSLSYRYVEKPAIALGRRLSRRWLEPRAVPRIAPA